MKRRGREYAPAWNSYEFVASVSFHPYMSCLDMLRCACACSHLDEVSLQAERTLVRQNICAGPIPWTYHHSSRS